MVEAWYWKWLIKAQIRSQRNLILLEVGKVSVRGRQIEFEIKLIVVKHVIATNWEMEVTPIN